MPRLPLQRPADTPVSQPGMTHASPPIAPASPTIPTKRPFTARQQAFIEHYVVCKNASEAARQAGYSPKDANVNGPRLLANDSIRAEIDRRLAKIAEKLEITAERIEAEMAKTAFCNMGDFIGPDGLPLSDFRGLSRDQTAAIRGYTIEEFKDGRSDKREVRRIKFMLWDKDKNLENLAKHRGMSVERHDHKHEHQHTLMGHLLLEIDEESRGLVVEHEKGKAA